MNLVLPTMKLSQMPRRSRQRPEAASSIGEWEQIGDRVPQGLRDFSKRERAAGATSRQATPCQQTSTLKAAAALRCAALVYIVQAGTPAVDPAGQQARRL